MPRRKFYSILLLSLMWMAFVNGKDPRGDFKKWAGRFTESWQTFDDPFEYSPGTITLTLLFDSTGHFSFTEENPTFTSLWGEYKTHSGRYEVGDTTILLRFFKENKTRYEVQPQKSADSIRDYRLEFYDSADTTKILSGKKIRFSYSTTDLEKKLQNKNYQKVITNGMYVFQVPKRWAVYYITTDADEYTFNWFSPAEETNVYDYTIRIFLGRNPDLFPAYDGPLDLEEIATVKTPDLILWHMHALKREKN